MTYIKCSAQNACADLWWRCDFGVHRRIIYVLGLVSALTILGVLLYASWCLLSTALGAAAAIPAAMPPMA